MKPMDEREIRCPRLGHDVPFGYCRRENMGLPCQRTLLCWESWPEAIEILRRELTQEIWDQSFHSQPKPKVVTLIELIERAKKGRKATDEERH